MAPSTNHPSGLQRGSIACLQCRTSKVRCLLSQSQSQQREPSAGNQARKCERCINNNTECIFVPSRRARDRHQPYRRSPGRTSLPPPSCEPTMNAQVMQSASPSPVPDSYAASDSVPHFESNGQLLHTSVSGYTPGPLISSHVRARIVVALASLKGKRGAPFSFVTAGDTPMFSTGNQSHGSEQASDRQLPVKRACEEQPSLKLSWLLRPLRVVQNSDPDTNETSILQTSAMPTYLTSTTLGQMVTDPVEGGILSHPTAMILYDHFMTEMNAKWEFLLDPIIDTCEDVRQRSSLLFTTILFCSSKFARVEDGKTLYDPDIFAQIRLCGLARNLAVRAFAIGDRSIESMQAFYLLACWKEPDDDISYLHSGYAFRVLHDLDSRQREGNQRHAARYRRTWLALYRQDKQQSLFFIRQASHIADDEGTEFVGGGLGLWPESEHTLPSDFVAASSADLRQIQVKLRRLVQKASPTMLPCLLELLDSDLRRWKSSWQSRLKEKSRDSTDHATPLDEPRFMPGGDHVNALLKLWEQSVRLNVASAIFRQGLLAAVSSIRLNEQQATASLALDLPAVTDMLGTDFPGLSGSVEGAFGTLRQLLSFPPQDLRRSPDSVLLLASNAALFLCLLLCLPCKGILGMSFQKTAIGLVREIAYHVGESTQSPNDSVALLAVYLSSLVQLLDKEDHDTTYTSQANDPQMSQPDSSIGLATFNGAEGLGSEANMFSQNSIPGEYTFATLPEHDMQLQSIANLLDPGGFWTTSLADANAAFELNMG